MKYHEEAFMEEYIVKNSRLRGDAPNKFEKDRLKLMNNSNYGKCFENIRDYKNCQLINDEKIAHERVQKDNFMYIVKIIHFMILITKIQCI
jgi:hypothetical protein